MIQIKSIDSTTIQIVENGVARELAATCKAYYVGNVVTLKQLESPRVEIIAEYTQIVVGSESVPFPTASSAVRALNQFVGSYSTSSVSISVSHDETLAGEGTPASPLSVVPNGAGIENYRPDKEYEAGTMVYDADTQQMYYSVQDVPQGTPLDDNDFWEAVSNVVMVDGKVDKTSGSSLIYATNNAGEQVLLKYNPQSVSGYSVAVYRADKSLLTEIPSNPTDKTVVNKQYVDSAIGGLPPIPTYYINCYNMMDFDSLISPLNYLNAWYKSSMGVGAGSNESDDVIECEVRNDSDTDLVISPLLGFGAVADSNNYVFDEYGNAVNIAITAESGQAQCTITVPPHTKANFWYAVSQSENQFGASYIEIDGALYGLSTADYNLLFNYTSAINFSFGNFTKNKITGVFLLNNLGITHISGNGFCYNCNNLQSLTLPDSLTEISGHCLC
jgi:hypothetical protein